MVPAVFQTYSRDFLRKIQEIRNFKEKRLQISIATALLLLWFSWIQFGSDEVSIKNNRGLNCRISLDVNGVMIIMKP
jgi:hypothetical protein